MIEDGQALRALAILVFATLALIIAATVALIRSRRIPGLGATTGHAVVAVAEAMLASRRAVELDPPGALEPSANA